MPIRARSWHGYRVAGRSIAMNHHVPALEPYRTSEVDVPPLAFDPLALPGPSPEAGADVVEGLVGGVVHRISVRHDGMGTWLDVPEVATLWVAADGGAVGVIATALAAGAGAVQEAVAGPGLIVALAHRRTYCLHASSVAVAGRAVAFVGDSGAGKSTLAAMMDAEAQGWRRLTDDILPIALDDGVAIARPDFPQLKLPPEATASHGVGDAGPGLPLAAVYELDGSDDEAVAEVCVDTLSPASQVVALLAHSVATRLFTQAASAQHFDAMVAVTRQVPVRRLRYPRRHDVAARVAAAIVADLA